MHGDRQARHGDEAVAEDALAREEVMISLTTPMRGQDHDVDGRVRVEPEQVLEQDAGRRLARVEDAELEDPLDADQQERDRHHGRAEHHG